MKKIKFRAWDVVNKKWIGDKHLEYLCVDRDIAVLVKYKVASNGSYEPFYCKQLTNPEFDNLEIVQFTGLLDKNGKEIFEGDILSNRNASYWDGLSADFEIYMVVKMDPTSGVKMYPIADDKSINYQDFDDEDTVYFYKETEVIGNIYENPELVT